MKFKDSIMLRRLYSYVYVFSACAFWIDCKKTKMSLILFILGVAVVTVAPGSYLRLVPHFYICETTNIFFNLAWVLRAGGWKGNSIVLSFEYLFALFFFPIRIFNMSLVIWLLHMEVNPIFNERNRNALSLYFVIILRQF